jgi:hypothetical protein
MIIHTISRECAVLRRTDLKAVDNRADDHVRRNVVKMAFLSHFQLPISLV